MILYEGLQAFNPTQPPEDPIGVYPPASAIIAAYLPNEAATIEETIDAFLWVEYPGELQVILAYNTPHDLPIEARLHELAQRDPRFVPLRVSKSTSKAQNVNTALSIASGQFVGIFDADHHPDQNSFLRAWQWLANGYDVVQGHCLVRNGSSSWVARYVAVEFEAIYAVSHPGRAKFHGFGIFGGSNGFWQTDLLWKTRMQSMMLTEDIDSSIRVVAQGYRVASDPLLISRELATTLAAFWKQRLHWSQGWFQVSLRHFWSSLTSPNLTLRQRMGAVHLLIWREVYPWLSFQMLPLICYFAWQAGGLDKLDWFIPLWVITTLITQSTALAQTIFAYWCGDPSIRQHRDWYSWFLVVGFFFFTPLKNVIAMLAQIKEAMRESVWHITPRG